MKNGAKYVGVLAVVAVCFFTVGSYFNEFSLRLGSDPDAKLVVHRHFSSIHGKHGYQIFPVSHAGQAYPTQDSLVWGGGRTTRYDKDAVLSASDVCRVSFKTNSAGDLIGIGIPSEDDDFGPIQAIPPVKLQPGQVYYLLDFVHYSTGANCIFRELGGENIEFAIWGHTDPPVYNF